MHNPKRSKGSTEPRGFLNHIELTKQCPTTLDPSNSDHKLDVQTAA